MTGGRDCDIVSLTHSQGYPGVLTGRVSLETSLHTLPTCFGREAELKPEVLQGSSSLIPSVDTS